MREIKTKYFCDACKKEMPDEYANMFYNWQADRGDGWTKKIDAELCYSCSTKLLDFMKSIGIDEEVE